MPPPRARLMRVAAVALAFAAIAVIAAPDAVAHAVLVAATPAPGAELREPPTEVRIWFSEPLDASLSGIRLYGSTGMAVALGAARVESTGSRVYAVALPPLRPDRYTVVWHTVSAIDGHTRGGSYVFTIDRPDGSPPRIAAAVTAGPRGPPDVPAAAPAAAAAMWCGLAGLFLLVGAVVIATLCGGPEPTAIHGLRRRLWQVSLAGVLLVIAGAAGELAADWASSGAGAAGLGSLLSSSAGRWLTVRVAAVLVAALAWPRSPRAGSRRRFAVAALGAGVTAFSFAATAHGAASTLPALGLAFEFVHVLAAGVWLGGAIALAVAWVVGRNQDAAARHALLRRYSVVAGVAVPLVLATGLGNAVAELGSVADLICSSYGVSLLVKLVAALVLLGVAAVNAVVLRPAHAAGRPGGRRLGYTIAVEAALGIAVLVPTAVMAVEAPPRPIDQARAAARAIRASPDPAHTFTGSTSLQGRAVEVSVTPGAVGPNAVRIEVSGRYPASAIRMSLTGPGGSTTTGLARTGHDHDSGTHTIYQGALRLPSAGMWHALVQRAGAAPGPPLLVPVSRTGPGLPAPRGSGNLSAWLALLALAGGAVALGALARAAPTRRIKTGALVAGTLGLTAALAWAGTLALGDSGGAGQLALPASWGVARTVQPLRVPDATVWRVPTAGAGLMTPAVAPDGSVWVSEMNADKLARLDPHRGVVQEFRFPGNDRESMGVAVDASGRVWIAQEHAMALGMFDPAAGRYREFPVPGRNPAPVGLAVDAQGNVWFSEMSGDRIGRFDPRSGQFTSYPIPTPNAAPYGLAVAPDGDIWFTEFATGKVGVLDPRSGTVKEYAVPGGKWNVPGIAVGRSGAVWFTTIQGALFRLAPSSGHMLRVPLPAAGDYGVVVTPNGTVWVGRQGGQTLYAVNPTSAAVRAVRLPVGSAPWWPTVDRRGRIWVALAGDRGNGLALVRPRS